MYMYVSVFIGNNARKYASQLPSYLKTYTCMYIYIYVYVYAYLSLCLCVPCTVLLKNIRSATILVYRSLFQLILM